MQDLVDKEGEGAKNTKEWQDAQAKLEESLGGASEVFEQYGSDVQGAIDKLKEMTEELRKQAILNAMQKRLNDTYELLGEAYTKKYEAGQDIIFAQNEIEAIDKRRKESSQAYAKEFLNLAFGQDTSGWTKSQYWEAFKELPSSAGNKFLYSNPMELMNSVSQALNVMFEGADMGSAIGKALQNYYTLNKVGSTGTVWGKSEYDYVVAPETYEGLTEAVEKQKKIISDSESAIKDADNSIKLCNESIDKVTAAIQYAEEELKNGADDTSDEVDKGAKDIETGLRALAAKFASYTIPMVKFTMSTGGTGKSAIEQAIEENGKNIPNISLPGFASGLDTVPFDGFKAVLHKNEAVLTAREADRWRRGGMNAEQVAGMISDAIEESMSKIAVMMSGEKVGDLTTKRVRNNIKAYDYARTRAMGG